MLKMSDVETGGRRIFDPNDLRDIRPVDERHPAFEDVDWDKEHQRLDRMMRSNRYCRL